MRNPQTNQAYVVQMTNYTIGPFRSKVVAANYRKMHCGKCKGRLAKLIPIVAPW